MSRISNPFRYAFRKPSPSVMCVYKLWFGKKYGIYTAKALHQNINSTAIQLDQRLRLGYMPDNPYYKVLQHIRSRHINVMEVDVVKQVESPLEMLQIAYTELQKGKKDPNCLNMTFEPYVAQWIPETDKLAYEKWVAEKAKKKPVKRVKQPVAGKQSPRPKKAAPASRIKRAAASKTSTAPAKRKK